MVRSVNASIVSRVVNCIVSNVSSVSVSILRGKKINKAVAGVKLRLFRVYIESLTMSSQEPPKKKVQTR